MVLFVNHFLDWLGAHRYCNKKEIEAEDTVKELVEMVHMSLFLIMIGLIVQIISLLRIRSVCLHA